MIYVRRTIGILIILAIVAAWPIALVMDYMSHNPSVTTGDAAWYAAGVMGGCSLAGLLTVALLSWCFKA